MRCAFGLSRFTEGGSYNIKSAVYKSGGASLLAKGCLLYTSSIREFIVINLKRSGYDVVEAENGEEAINKYEEENGNIAVAVLDIMMPLKDGLEAVSYTHLKS